ncbi:alpha/beta hydrolase [Marinomonas agarivorans]|nr:alpha/beta hydrolase [Marinomonas agarivorans]
METRKQAYAMINDDKQDFLGPNYRSRTLQLASGHVCTLVSYEPNTQPNLSTTVNKAILYIHGYTDYFFQTGLAEYCHNLGYRFYAVDLQGYGRSIRPNRPPTSCHSVLDYHDDMAAAMAVMQADGVTECVPLGHSTGGLIVTSYLRLHQAKHQNLPECTENRLFIKGVILNSPFLSMPLSISKEPLVLPIYQKLAQWLSFVHLSTNKVNPYSRSLHTRFAGEWSYRLDWKPACGFSLSFAWLYQIMREQALCAKASIDIPTLCCRSHISTYMARTVEQVRQGDGVLNVENMEKKAQQIYQNLSVSIIKQGFHDLYLSPAPVRYHYLDSIKIWLTQLD